MAIAAGRGRSVPRAANRFTFRRTRSPKVPLASIPDELAFDRCLILSATIRQLG
ncbi:hypothetical protein [Kitasatospora purpeofusca]|uniref:hypothetical protein n=1 Tax=Kitasatospora purpeofusca TaxID=67352 RepID=UPI003651F2F0